MKKQKLLLVAGIVLATTIGYSQSNNLKIGGQNLDNGDYVGSNNNNNLVIKTNGQTNTIFKKEGGIEVKKLASFDSVSISKYLRADSIHARSIRVGNNSLWLGTPPLQNLVGTSDYIQSDNGIISFGKWSGLIPYTPALFSQFKMGIGFNNPVFNLHIHDAQVGPNDVKQSFSNQGTGSSSSDGFQIGILSNQSAILRQQELNQPVNIVTQGGFVGANNSNNSFFVPRSLMHISDGANRTDYQVTNNSTGVLAADGFKMGITNAGIAQINQQENLDLQFHTNNTQRMVIKNAGRVGIGLNTPANRLEIASNTGDPYFVSGNGSSGLKFANLNSNNVPSANPSGKVLALDNVGNVILVPDGGTAGPAIVTAQNGLNTSVASPAVELGGTLLHNTDVDQNNNNLVWKGNGQFGIGTGIPNASSFYSGSRFELNDNAYNSSMYIRNVTPGGSVGLEMDILGGAVTNLGHRINIQGGQNNIGVDINAIGVIGSTVNEGIVCYAKEGVTTYGAYLVAQTSDPGTLDAFGSVNQLDLNDPHNFSRRAGSGSIVIGQALGTKYGAVATTHTFNNDMNVGFGGIIGVNGINTIDVCNGTTVKNIAVYGAFFDPTPYNQYNAQTVGNFAGYFDGDVNITGDLTVVGSYPSDATLKTNIDTITNALATLKLLQPKQFYYDTTKHFLASHSQKQYGLLAQDVINVLPELVGSYGVADKKDTLGNIISAGGMFKNLNYNALIGILIKGVQEQQRTIDSIRTVLSSTTSARIINPANNPNATTNVIALNKQNVTLSNADALVLDQNQPNPFSESTVIKYNVPEKYGYAQLIFTTLDGRILKTVDITKKGAGEITVYANDLSNGIYTYTLVVDGKTVDTKKMIKQN